MASVKQIEKARNFRDIVLWSVDNFGGYTTVNNVVLITKYSKKGAISALRSMVKDGLFYEHSVTHDGAKILLFGITQHGRSVADNDHDNSQDMKRAFSIKNIRVSTVTHEMLTQRFGAMLHRDKRIQNVQNGARIIGGYNDRKKKRKIGGRRPDGIYTDEADRTYAFEVELTIKSLARYKQIFTAYAAEKMTVTWFLPDNIAHRFSKIIENCCANLKEINMHVIYVFDHGDLHLHETSKAHQQALEDSEKLEHEERERAKQEEQKIIEETQRAGEEYERKTARKKTLILTIKLIILTIVLSAGALFGPRLIISGLNILSSLSWGW